MISIILLLQERTHSGCGPGPLLLAGHGLAEHAKHMMTVYDHDVHIKGPSVAA